MKKMKLRTVVSNKQNLGIQRIRYWEYLFFLRLDQWMIDLFVVRSISCDFEDSYHCGYTNDTTSSPLQWLQSMVVDYTLVTDHTHRSTNTSTRGSYQNNK